MPAEQLSPDKLTGKHLEAFYVKHMEYHSGRVLEAFGTDEPLPPLDQGDPVLSFDVSEKRYRKALEVLYKDEPMSLPDETGISQNYLTRLADQMSYKALELMITSSHLAELRRIENRLLAGSAGEIANNGRLKLPHGLARSVHARIKEIKPIAIDGNHLFRDFFSNGEAKQLKIGSLGDLERFLKRAYIVRDKSDLPSDIAKGIAMEISAHEWLQTAMEHDAELSGQQDTMVFFGGHEEDRNGGDIVVLRHQNQTLIDIKNHRPDGLFDEDEIEQGYRLRFAGETWKATVWAESAEPVARDSFRLTDPAMKHALRKVLIETSPKVAETARI